MRVRECLALLLIRRLGARNARMRGAGSSAVYLHIALTQIAICQKGAANRTINSGRGPSRPPGPHIALWTPSCTQHGTTPAAKCTLQPSK